MSEGPDVDVLVLTSTLQPFASKPQLPGSEELRERRIINSSDLEGVQIVNTEQAIQRQMPAMLVMVIYMRASRC